MRFLVFLIGFVVAILILKYRAQVRDFLGEVSFAEKYLGTGGTNTLIILIALAVFIISMMYALGTLDAILVNSFGRFF